MKKHIKKLTSLILTLALTITMVPVSSIVRNEKVKAATLSNPRIVPDSSMAAGQKVTWDCIFFGSYPQAEVVPSGEYEALNPILLQDGDIFVSDDTYNELQNATGWSDDGDITLNGQKYRRIKKGDVTCGTSGNSSDYNWSDSRTYHYFKYEPIKWRVLSVDGNDAFLLADKALDNQRYIISYGVNIRSWLNGYGTSSDVYRNGYSNKNFIETAFSGTEQSAIHSTTVINNDNVSSGTDGENNTNDKVFLLSNSEVWTYDAEAYGYGFTPDRKIWDEARRSKSSTYAKAMGTYSATNTSYAGNCCWRVGTPSDEITRYSSSVGCEGGVDTLCYVGYDYYGVRPALHLNLSSSNLYYYAGTVCSDGTKNEEGSDDTIHGDYDSSTSIDDYMIEQVKKYTSDSVYSQYEYIVNSNMSDELKFKRLNELFGSYGITDVNEGIKYLSQTTSHRANYLYLTTNDIYCSYNFYNWLYSPWGTIPRGLLYADGLIFNWEVGDYIDPSTYVENDYPGVKKNKAMLKQFLGTEEKKSEVFDYANKSAKYLKNIIKLNKIKFDDSTDEILDKMVKCTSEEELEKLNRQFINDYVIPAIKAEGKDEVYLDGKQFSEALGYASSILKFTGATVDDVLEIMNLSNEIEVYKKYSNFLTTIYQCKDVSIEMRMAAWSLLDDIDNGYMNKLKGIIANCFNLEKDLIVGSTDMWKEYFGDNGEIFGDALSTIKLAVFISNIVINTGDFVNQAAYTQGYAELSTLYSLKLMEDKENFKKAQTAENAWKFFEDYSILWSLRYEGENQYLRMNQVKMYLFAKVNTWKYNLKEEVVKDTISRLDKAKFEISSEYDIPNSVQYSKKAVINCPVNVDVYNKNGTLIASMKDGEESDTINEYGRFAVVYQPYSGEYAKVICQSTDEELVVKLTAVDDGTVDYQITEATDEESNVYTFDNLKVSEGDTITTSTDVNETQYEVKPSGQENVKTNTFIEKNPSEYVKVESLKADVDEVSLKEGESNNVGITVLPVNATSTETEWISSDENVAVVKNGVIRALHEGTATIYVRTLDDAQIEDEILVTVTKNQEESTTENVETTKDETTTETEKQTTKSEESTNTTQESVTTEESATRDNESTGKEEQPTNQTERVTTKAVLENITKGNTEKSQKIVVKRPKTSKIKKIKKAKKSLKVIWKKIKGVSGYQIQYSKSSKFKKAKKITIKKAKTTSKVIKKLKTKKKYYVRIRTYVTVNGTKKYSDWSKKKSQKTK